MAKKKPNKPIKTTKLKLNDPDFDKLPPLEQEKELEKKVKDLEATLTSIANEHPEMIMFITKWTENAIITADKAREAGADVIELVNICRPGQLAVIIQFITLGYSRVTLLMMKADNAKSQFGQN